MVAEVEKKCKIATIALDTRVSFRYYGVVNRLIEIDQTTGTVRVTDRTGQVLRFRLEAAEVLDILGVGGEAWEDSLGALQLIGFAMVR